jgi:glyoxalase family protein
LRFEDPEGQRLTLVDDGGAETNAQLWDGAGVPAEFAIRGFYGVQLSTPNLGQIDRILTEILGFTEISRQPGLDNPKEEVIIFGMDGGGPGKEVQLIVQPGTQRAFLGAGGVHHVAFRVKDVAEQQAWMNTLNRWGLRNSGEVDRYYFKSLYFRISGGILFELATDGPGFATDENVETLGERLALPPFLEPHRAQIEANLKPLDTTVTAN